MSAVLFMNRSSNTTALNGRTAEYPTLHFAREDARRGRRGQRRGKGAGSFLAGSGGKTPYFDYAQ